ncbi:MAG: lactonase family protein [Balneolaceae bacterium]|nr:lactonase family protein [Balneolaceae bacterium]
MYRLLLLCTICVMGMACKQKTNPDTHSKTDSEMIKQPEKIFIGTYTRDEGWVNGKGDGIYLASLADDGSSITDAQIVAELVNPTFLNLSPDRKNLYAVSEIGGGEPGSGLVVAYAIGDDATLTEIGRYPTNAFSPCYVIVDATGKFVFVANYQGGVAMVYRRNDDGSLDFVQELNHEGSGPHPNQNASHPHMTKISPDNNYLFVPDLGSDKIWSYRINHDAGTVSKTEQEFAQMAPGAGPRHMDFHPSKNLVYVINELNSTVSVMEYDPALGALEEIQAISTLPDDFTDWNSSADIHVHPNGKFVYASNRGHNSIAAFSIDEDSGTLTSLGQVSTEGEFPRNFAIHPSGEFIYAANQNSDSITIFSINSETGTFKFTGSSLEVSTPVNITFY